MPSVPASEAAAGLEIARDDLKVEDDGNIVGREGPRRDVKVLVIVSWIGVSRGACVYTFLHRSSTPVFPLLVTQPKL